jgi:hypothetical protein
MKLLVLYTENPILDELRFLIDERVIFSKKKFPSVDRRLLSGI